MWSTYMCSHSTVLLVLLLQHRALLNPLVEDRNGWFCVRLLHVLEPSTTLRRGAQSSAMYVAYRELRTRHIPARQLFRTDSLGIGTGNDWIFELKYDGFRALAVIAQKARPVPEIESSYGVSCFCPDIPK